VAELPGNSVVLTGTNFIAGTSVSFGGSASPNVVVSSSTSLTATVPIGAPAGASSVVVTTAGVSSVSAPAFTVLEVYNAGALNTCTTAVPATASLNDGQWHYLLSASGQVVASYSYTGASLGSLAVDVLRADPAAPVRQDSRGRAYLDRGFHLTASAGAFPGRTVAVRFYGLTSEFARLQAADASVSYAGLKTTQYSGPNEDCDLGNNAASGQRRTLAAPASTPTGAPWFVAQASVTDHFSEFFLTGSVTPLPVELTEFTATLVSSAVRLAWATASEKNSARFEVERSLDGKVFATIGTVAAAGSSGKARAYELLDGKLPTNVPTLYYRLRQVDLDGTASYSPVRGITPSRIHSFSIFPNPAHTGAVTLTGAAIRVFDALGRPVAAASADAAGAATLVLPAGLPAGVYVARVGAEARRLTVE
jgi:hypothetical protein